MRFGWNRGEDGVITVFARTSDGRTSDIADFWLRPLIEKLGADKATAHEIQEQAALMLVSTHNRLFTAQDCDECSGSGFLVRMVHEPSGGYRKGHNIPCPYCDGTGGFATLAPPEASIADAPDGAAVAGTISNISGQSN